jgi:isochorismate hydrolase
MERRQLIIAGIEAHICVYQTAVDLLRWDMKSMSRAMQFRHELSKTECRLALMEKAGQ